MMHEQVAPREQAVGTVVRERPAVGRDPTAGRTTVRRAWSAFHSRFLLRALDAIVTTDSERSIERGPSGRGTSNFHRIQTIVRTTHRVLPGPVDWVRKRLHLQRALPFREPAEKVVGFGAGSTVYALGGQADGVQPELVLKIFRNSLGRPLPTLLEQAAMLRERYHRIRDWYSGTSIAVPVEYVILHSPLLGQPAVAGLQPFVGGETQDFFELVSAGGWSELIEGHPALRAQFRLFVERTLTVFETEDLCLDLVGKDNLLVVVRDGQPRLKVIDHGVIDLREQRREAPWRAEAATERIMSLRRLHDEAFGVVAQADNSRSKGD